MVSGAEPILETRDLGIRFGGHVAVDAVSLAFRAGEVTAIVGPNGAGKTTFFNLISGQLRATSGRVLLEGRDVTRLSPSARAQAGIGRAFQQTSLFGGLPVIENVALALRARQGGKVSMLRRVSADRALAQAAEALLDGLRLGHLADRMAAELSHGDQRKLEVALMIALDPKVCLFDEPSAGMSAEDAPAVLDLVAGLRGQEGRTLLLVEHKMDVIARLADRVVVLHNGRLLAEGAPSEVMADPRVQEAYMGRALADV